MSAAERADVHDFWRALVPRDAPTLRSEVYADPDTHRVLTFQKYAHFSTTPAQSELLICEYTYDYANRPDAAMFSPSAILKGAKEIDNFRESGGKTVHVITHTAHSRSN